MIRLAALALLLGGALLVHGQPGGLRLTAPGAGSGLSGAAQPALAGVRDAARGLVSP